MGKRNSKLKQDTIDKLIEDTYCKFFQNIKCCNAIIDTKLNKRITILM